MGGPKNRSFFFSYQQEGPKFPSAVFLAVVVAPRHRLRVRGGRVGGQDRQRVPQRYEPFAGADVWSDPQKVSLALGEHCSVLGFSACSREDGESRHGAHFPLG